MDESHFEHKSYVPGQTLSLCSYGRKHECFHTLSLAQSNHVNQREGDKYGPGANTCSMHFSLGGKHFYVKDFIPSGGSQDKVKGKML